ncbi:enhancer of polycomb homolog 1-like isoform X1 [Mytilus galloprovincialis]|uniref:enhancer of polycomb homolog 1-like n=1 Tax=Mytilus edulis TaxID=6550 RepID=UPI0039F06F7D
MSKVSFRARALDATKPMPVYRAEEIPDLPDFANINRSVPAMPTGMEKEEETEHHLQRYLSAQQVYGTADALVIPIPDVETIKEDYDKLYKGEFKPTKQYIHIQACGMEQEIPDYDMDSEDESWVEHQSKKMEISALKFEEMMDRLEKGSGQQVVTLQEAKLLLKEDDDLIIAVYDYWLNKRLRLAHPLILQVKTEKRDGSTTNNPYVAFRRRTEKMQTRKNRKNDETSYEKMLKLRRDLNRAVTLLEMIKRREKTKKEMVQLTIEVVDKRYAAEDYEGKMLEEAEALRHKMPSFLSPYTYGGGWSQEEMVVKKKREYRKRKHKQVIQQQREHTVTSVQQSHYNDIDVLHPDFSSEDEGLSPGMSPSDHEEENDPDGLFAFRRKRNCHYHAPILNRLGNWPWCSQEDGGMGDKKYRYNLTSLSQPPRCIGFARRRLGRGGRVLLDRAFSEFDEPLYRSNFSSQSTSLGEDYNSYIRENKIPYFRPHSPTEEDHNFKDRISGDKLEEEFNLESFQSHREQLLQMQRDQEEQLLKQTTCDFESAGCSGLDQSFSSQPTSRFMLDSASAKFAVSAVINTTQVQTKKTGAISSLLSSTSLPLATSSFSQPAAVSLQPSSVALTNGPISDSKPTGLSTSPAATVLQLNFPITNNNKNSSNHNLVTSTATSLSSVLMSTQSFLPVQTIGKTVQSANHVKISPGNFTHKLIKTEDGKLNSIIQSDKIVAMDVT